MERKSNRKRQNVDYSKFDALTEEPSPPYKCHKPNLLCKPSKTVLAAHKKHKMMPPLSTGKMVTMAKETSVHVPCKEAKASTSTSTARTSTSTSTAVEAEPLPIGTLTVNASQEETKTTIAAPPDEDLTTENAALVPINPNITGTDTVHKSVAPTLNTDPPEVKPAAVPVHKRFVTVEYKLKGKYRRPRKFPCTKCRKCFSTQKEVNGHFKETHPLSSVTIVTNSFHVQ